MKMKFKQGDPAPDQLPSGMYRKPAAVKLWGPLTETFECESREGTLEGQVGDFVAADGHGGYYPISAEFHAANYEEVRMDAERSDGLALPPFEYVDIQLQDGPVHEHGVNGCQIDDVIKWSIVALRQLNVMPHSCRQNSIAVTKLEEALHWLQDRTAEREQAGVEGTSRSLAKEEK